MGGKIPSCGRRERGELAPVHRREILNRRGLSESSRTRLGWHIAYFAPVSTLSCACALRYVAGTSDDEKSTKLEIASKGTIKKRRRLGRQGKFTAF
jgi:hypothetical protein